MNTTTHLIPGATSLLRTGFAALERPLHPVEEREIDDIPYLHWPTRGRRGAEFTEEFYAIDANPDLVLAAIGKAMPGPDHLIAEISINAQQNEDSWLGAGYEFGSAEPIMILELSRQAPSSLASIPVPKLTRMSDAERILKAHESVGYPQRLFNQTLLDEPTVSIRVIWSDTGEFVAIGKAALLPDGAVVNDVMTMPDSRKQGYGRLIMDALHLDAITAGCPISVLTSTAGGKSLYESLGYREIGLQTLYATPRT